MARINVKDLLVAKNTVHKVGDAMFMFVKLN